MLTNAENRRILIIDDTESIHRDFRKTLLRSGGDETLDSDETLLFGETPKSAWRHSPFVVDSAMQGQDGFAKVRQAKAEGHPFALAFVDMRMPPGWDGVQTIKNLWREDPNLQVVICTAHSDYSWEQIVEELGMSDRLLILKKPFDNAEVCQLANALTEKWQLSRKAQMNVDELKRLVEERTRELQHLALHDKLTGLPNRAMMNEQLKEAIAMAKQGEKFALLFLDFDRFKVINDSLGHQTGDMLLVAIADRIRQTLGKNYTKHAMAARLGGDEFTVLLGGLTDFNQTMELVDDLRAILHKPHLFRGHEVFSTVSIGITNSDIGYTQPEEVLRDADNAMYRAKMAGKDRYMVFDRSMHEAACARLEIESELSRAMEREEIMLHYQPIVNIETGRIMGFEALCRWRHPVRGMVSPAEFIPVAEEMGLICYIGEWAMREACRQLAQWRTAYPDAADMYMSVNLSKRQVVENVLLRQVQTALAETGLPPKCLRLEVTESLIMDDPGQIIPLLEQLRQAGVGLSIDDFGTGHSSLTWLSQFPVDVLKIDRGFITQLNAAKQYGAIIHAIISLAGNLNMQVTAEGVERLDQLAQIQAMDCQSAQGYLFSPAVPAEQCAAMLSARKSFARNALTAAHVS